MDFDVENLKLRINALLWETLPSEVTIGEADVLACDFLNAVLKTIKKQTSDPAGKRL